MYGPWQLTAVLYPLWIRYTKLFRNCFEIRKNNCIDTFGFFLKYKCSHPNRYRKFFRQHLIIFSIFFNYTLWNPPQMTQKNVIGCGNLRYIYSSWNSFYYFGIPWKTGVAYHVSPHYTLHPTGLETMEQLYPQFITKET